MSKRGIVRLLHTTILRNQMLVGPPHPLSNLRPALYNGVRDDQPKTNAYAPNEFQSHVTINPDKFQLDNSLRSLDKLNHDFWAEVSVRFPIVTLVLTPNQSNRRFHQQRDAYVNTHKGRLDAATSPEERAAMEEQVMNEFYGSWVQTMRPIQHEYTTTWLHGQYGGILTAARMTWRLWMGSINRTVGNS
jgi:hypothetical protein